MVTISLTTDSTKLTVRPHNYDKSVNEVMEKVPGKRWYKPFGCWLAPFSNETFEFIKGLLTQVTEVRIDQQVNDALEKQEKRASSVLEIKTQQHTATELPSDLTFHVPPFNHQKTAINLGLKNRAFAYFMEMGTGKTKVILDLIGYHLPKTRELHRPSLVICPVSVMWNWKRQAGIHRPELKVQVLDGGLDDKMSLLATDADIFVINYESVWRILDVLSKIRWGFMVLDESTRIKNRATKQAKAIIKLGAIASRRYILTGTPSPNTPLELFNQIKFLDPNVFGDNWYFFRDRYCIMGGYGGYQVLGFRNLDELSRKIGSISYRVLKSECLDLPDKIYKQYRLPMEENQAKTYKELSEDLVTEVSGTEIRTEVVLAKLTKLRQIASGFVYLPDGTPHLFENNKLAKLKEIVDEYYKNHKIVIWVSFREEMEIIRNAFNYIRYEWLDGSVPVSKRQGKITSFQEDSDVRLFIANQRSGGIGIDLYAGDYCIFYSNDYSPEVRLQAEDRLHRIGQRNHVTYIDLISRGSIDSTIFRMLAKKQDVSAQIMTGRKNIKEVVYGDDGDF